MSSEPLQLHQFVVRSILLFLIIGTTLLLAFAVRKDSVRDLGSVVYLEAVLHAVERRTRAG